MIEENIKELILNLDRDEKRIFRHLQNGIDKIKSHLKTQDLFDAFDVDVDVDSFQEIKVSKKTYYNLYEKILDSLLLDVNLQRSLSGQDFELKNIEISKLCAQRELMYSRGLLSIALTINEKIARKALKYSRFETVLNCISFYDQLQNGLSCFKPRNSLPCKDAVKLKQQALDSALEALFRINESNLDIQSLQKISHEFETIWKQYGCKISHLTHLVYAERVHSKRNEYNHCSILWKEIQSLVNSIEFNRRDVIEFIHHLRLSRLAQSSSWSEIRLYESNFIELDKSIHFRQKNSYILLLAYINNNEEESFIKKIKDGFENSNSIERDKFHFNLCFHSVLRNEKCLYPFDSRKLERSSFIWALNVRLFRIIKSIQRNDFDLAENEYNNLRKHVSRNRESYLNEIDLEQLLKVFCDWRSALFSIFHITNGDCVKPSPIFTSDWIQLFSLDPFLCLGPLDFLIRYEELDSQYPLVQVKKR